MGLLPELNEMVILSEKVPNTPIMTYIICHSYENLMDISLNRINSDVMLNATHETISLNIKLKYILTIRGAR